MQRISATFVQPANFFAVVAPISDLHPCTKCPESEKFLNGEADGLGGCGEATITGRRASPDTLALVHIQFGRCAEVEFQPDHISLSISLSFTTRSNGSSALLMRYSNHRPRRRRTAGPHYPQPPRLLPPKRCRESARSVAHRPRCLNAQRHQMTSAGLQASIARSNGACFPYPIGVA